MEEKKLFDTLNADVNSNKGKFNIARKIATAITAFSMSVFVAFGAAACGGQEQETETPVNPNPPIVTPVDPENPDPENPNPETPDPVDPEPEKPNTVDPEPEPEDPEIDYDKLTAADLTEEQKAKIVENVTTALKDNIQRNIGAVGVVNKVIAIDFYSNYATLLLNFNGMNGETYGLFRYEMSSEMTYKNILTTELAPKTSNSRGEEPIKQFSTKSRDNRAEEALKKLLNDGVVNYDSSLEPLFISTANDAPGNGTNTILGCGVTNIYVYRIDEQKILRCQLAVKDDGNAVNDFLGYSLINGQQNVTYLKTGYDEFVFSQYALYNADGLINTPNSGQEN